MKFNKELDYYEVDCKIDIRLDNYRHSFKIIPKKCPRLLDTCKDKEYTCQFFLKLRQVDPNDSALSVVSVVCCDCENSIKFIMGD